MDYDKNYERDVARRRAQLAAIAYDEADKFVQFAKLAACKCCTRHQANKPISLSDGWIETEFHNTHVGDDQCSCKCRHNMRIMCRDVQGGFKHEE
jgi:hypothetical protein